MIKGLFFGFGAIFLTCIVIRLFWSWRESRRFWREWEMRRRRIDEEFEAAFIRALDEIRERKRREESGWTPSQN